MKNLVGVLLIALFCFTAFPGTQGQTKLREFLKFAKDAGKVASLEPGILKALSAAYTVAEIQPSTLYHGTPVDFDTDIRPASFFAFDPWYAAYMIAESSLTDDKITNPVIKTYKLAKAGNVIYTESRQTFCDYLKVVDTQVYKKYTDDKALHTNVNCAKRMCALRKELGDVIGQVNLLSIDDVTFKGQFLNTAAKGIKGLKLGTNPVDNGFAALKKLVAASKTVPTGYKTAAAGKGKMNFQVFEFIACDPPAKEKNLVSYKGKTKPEIAIDATHRLFQERKESGSPMTKIVEINYLQHTAIGGKPAAFDSTKSPFENMKMLTEASHIISEKDWNTYKAELEKGDDANSVIIQNISTEFLGSIPLDNVIPPNGFVGVTSRDHLTRVLTEFASSEKVFQTRVCCLALVAPNPPAIHSLKAKAAAVCQNAKAFQGALEELVKQPEKFVKTFNVNVKGIRTAIVEYTKFSEKFEKDYKPVKANFDKDVKKHCPALASSLPTAASLLIETIQRAPRYVLLLNEIKKLAGTNVALTTAIDDALQEMKVFADKQSEVRSYKKRSVYRKRSIHHSN